MFLSCFMVWFCAVFAIFCIVISMGVFYYSINLYISLCAVYIFCVGIYAIVMANFWHTEVMDYKNREEDKNTRRIRNTTGVACRNTK